MERSCSGRTETSLRIQILQLSRSRSGDAQAPSQVSPHHTSFLHLFIQPTLSFTPHTNLPLRYSSKNLSFGAGRLSSSEVGRLVEHMLTTDYLRLYCELKTFIPSFIPLPSTLPDSIMSTYSTRTLKSTQRSSIKW
jgi:hypothetical protein